MKGDTYIDIFFGTYIFIEWSRPLVYAVAAFDVRMGRLVNAQKGTVVESLEAIVIRSARVVLADDVARASDIIRSRQRSA